MVPSLFVASDRQAILARLARLKADSPRQWGKMDAAQMCAHLQVGMRLALGEMRLKRALIGVLFGRFAKRTLFSPKPWGRGLPTAPEFRIRDKRDFAREHAALAELLKSFGEGGPGKLTQEAHPFFGKMTTEEWSALQWRHVDHHFQQFGI